MAIQSSRLFSRRESQVVEQTSGSHRASVSQQQLPNEIPR